MFLFGCLPLDAAGKTRTGALWLAVQREIWMELSPDAPPDLQLTIIAGYADRLHSRAVRGTDHPLDEWQQARQAS